MKVTTRRRALDAALVVLSASFTYAAPTPSNPYPLQNGFPNPSQNEIDGIQKAAGGTLPNGPLPSTLQDPAVTTLNLIALNELFEVAYFSELLTNVTEKVSGFECGMAPECENIVKTLSAVLNQEELHALSANGALSNANQPTQTPCLYNFPVDDLKSAITLANTFTDVVLGALPNAQAQFATDGGDELGLVPVIGSIIGQEGEQNGFYRNFRAKSASAAPFLTNVPPAFAFSALQTFVVPGSCPQMDQVKLPTFPALNVIGNPSAKNGNLEFSCTGSVGPDDNSLVYISGQNKPVTVPISTVTSINGFSHFTADFPFEDSGFSKGLTIAALVKGQNAQFESASDVVDATIFGPGLIEV